MDALFSYFIISIYLVGAVVASVAIALFIAFSNTEEK